jgi:hypothetical protein
MIGIVQNKRPLIREILREIELLPMEFSEELKKSLNSADVGVSISPKGRTI